MVNASQELAKLNQIKPTNVKWRKNMKALKIGDKLNAVKTAENLRRIRKAHGDTQVQLCEKLGCSQSFLSKIEKAQCIMSMDMAVNICALYGLSIDQLIIINDATIPEIQITVG